MISSLRRRVPAVVVPLLVGASGLALTGCGGSSASSGATATQSATGDSSPGTRGGSYQMPGASGLIAAWSGGTLQVQGATTQTAVTVSASTRITQQKVTSASAVKVGSCVTVRPVTAGGQTPPATSAPITAGTVQVRAASNGSCTATGERRASASRSPRVRPSGNSSGLDVGIRGFGANGQVTQVTNNGFVVAGNRGGATTSVTVHTTSSTVYYTTVAATQSAIAVGECAMAVGASDSTGTVAARSLQLSQPVNGQCTSGMGRRNG